jgi:predicted nuclease with TOPRIM domain
MEINSAYLALAGAVFGGAGLEVIRKWLSRSKEKDDSATQFRTELREEVKNLRAELRQVEDDLEKWRDKYYELMDQFIKVKGELDASLRAINEDTQNIDLTKVAQAVDKANPPVIPSKNQTDKE